jgi:hypothetical protein
MSPCERGFQVQALHLRPMPIEQSHHFLMLEIAPDA